MELTPRDNPALYRIRWKNTCRLIPSRYPATGLLDRIASPEDLPLVFELESWSNDRISNELSVLHRIPESEWVTGPQSTVVMAAFCHPRADGGRFNMAGRGAWYAARRLGDGARGDYLPPRRGIGGDRGFGNAGANAAVSGRLCGEFSRSSGRCARSGGLWTYAEAECESAGSGVERGGLPERAGCRGRMHGMLSPQAGGACAAGCAL